VIVVGTKLDRAGAREAAFPPPGAELAYRVSSRSGEDVGALLDAIARRLPESPPLYPRTMSPIARCASSPRSSCARRPPTRSIRSCRTRSRWRSRSSTSRAADLVRIRANLIVERASQKKIVIGEGGRRIKQIGIRARHEIEKLLDVQVYLELWVKVEPRWTKRPARIKALGYV
jgi:GTP-binding protein Era